MTDSLESLRRQIDGAGELRSVVRSMKALAAASIGQYEHAVRALGDYHLAVELGLSACLRENAGGGSRPPRREPEAAGLLGAIVFGTDQGLVGQFNDVIADHVLQTLAASPGEARVWAVGERVHARFVDAGLPPVGLFAVPTALGAVAGLVEQLQIATETRHAKGEYARVEVFYNRPRSGGLYEPVSQRLLPLDIEWQRALRNVRWPTEKLPQVVGSAGSTMRALIGEYLFVSLFQACAASLASENASRLAAMQRAEKNIAEVLEELSQSFHRLRQESIDEELFDVISGYEALTAS